MVEDERVFVSYRRETSWALARLVFDDLTRHGFDVFMDVESIDSGTFDDVILREIASRTYFVVVLESAALPLGEPEVDWTSREIQHAIGQDRNVVPLVANGLRFDDVRLPAALVPLERYNALPVPSEYFAAAMERLRSRFLRRPDTDEHASVRRPRAPLPSAAQIAAAGRDTGAVVGTEVTSGHRPLYLTPQARRNGALAIDRTIDDALAGQVCARLLELATRNAEADVILYLSSPGGSVAATLKIYEMMMWIKPDVMTVAVGPVAGVVSLLLAAGTRGKRLARRSSRVHVGEPGCGPGATECDPTERMRSLEWLRGQLAALYAMHTGQAVTAIGAAMAADVWYSAPEAFAAGFVDGVER